MNDVDVRPLSDRAVAAAVRAGVGHEITDLRTLPGGHSGLTLTADLVGSDGDATPIVIKSVPAGRPAVGRHDVLRQARLFEDLSTFPGVKVPAVLFQDTDEPPFFAMELVHGDATEPILDGFSPAGIDAARAADMVKARALASADMLAALHRGDTDRVRSASPASIVDELARWWKTMSAADPEIVSGGSQLHALLASAVPAEQAPAVVHGDYRLGNLLCEDVDVVAIIDWEIWTVADPRLDLGWYLIHFDPRNYPGIGQSVQGLPDPDEIFARYQNAIGTTVADRAWFEAFGCFKLAAIMAHNLRRHREGRYHDPFQERLPPVIALQLERGIERLT